MTRLARAACAALVLSAAACTETALSADAGLSTFDGGDEPTLGEVGPVELHADLAQKDFLLIDVHTPDAGHLPGTDTSIPFDQVDAIAAYLGPELDRKAVLTCLTDHMSDIAGRGLASRGYRAIRHLKGGMRAWTDAGFPLE